MQFASLRIVLAALAIALAAPAGCAKIEQKDRAMKLEQAVRLYVDSIRWGNYETAASLVRRRGASTVVTAASVPAEVRVTAYASRIVSVDEEHGEASVATSFDYYYPTSGTVRTVSQSAIWWYEAESGQWFMDGSLPRFRQ